MLSRTAFGPGDVAVLEDECRARRADSVHRRLHDRLERLLEVERVRDRLRDLRERLELGDPGLRVCVELRVLDRLRDLGRDRDEQVDLGVRELPRLFRAHVQGAGQLLAGQDGDGQDRFVLVLREVRERLEALVEVRLLGDHDRRAVRGGAARDPFAGPHPRCARHLLDPGAMGRAEHELAGLLVVEVDEARVGLERVRDLARHQAEDLLQVERRVDRRARLGQEAQVTSGYVHGTILGRSLGPQRNASGDA